MSSSTHLKRRFAGVTLAVSLASLTSISLNNGVVVNGRMLARNGQVSLINTFSPRPLCGAGSTTPPAVEPPGGPGGVSPSAPGSTGPAGPATPGGGSTVGPGRAVPINQTRGRKATRNGRATVRLRRARPARLDSARRSAVT